MKTTFCMIGLMALTVFARAQNKMGFELMVNALISNQVDTIGTSDLEVMIQNGNTVLLDAREESEFDVSHLPGARWIGYDDFDLSRMKGISKSDSIVVYCSIGKRSGDIGEKLKEAGYQNVLNLYGGIFDWTNRNGIVVNDKNEAVKYVHPYSNTWGYWVNNYEKQYEPR